MTNGTYTGQTDLRNWLMGIPNKYVHFGVLIQNCSR